MNFLHRMNFQAFTLYTASMDNNRKGFRNSEDNAEIIEDNKDKEVLKKEKEKRISARREG